MSFEISDLKKCALDFLPAAAIGAGLGYLSGAQGVLQSVSWGISYAANQIILDEIVKKCFNSIGFMDKVKTVAVAGLWANTITKKIFHTTNLSSGQTLKVLFIPLLLKAIAQARVAL